MRQQGEQETGVAAFQGDESKQFLTLDVAVQGSPDANASTCASADVTSDQTFSLSSKRMCMYLPDIGSSST